MPFFTTFCHSDCGNHCGNFCGKPSGKIKQDKSEAKVVTAKIKPQTFREYMLSWLPDKAMEAILYFRKYYLSDNNFVCVNDKNRNHYTRRQIERTLERIVLNSRCRDKCRFSSGTGLKNRRLSHKIELEGW